MSVRVGAQLHPQHASYPDYDLSPLEELIAWRDDYRERNGEAIAS